MVVVPSHPALWHVLHLLADSWSQRPVCECHCEAGSPGGGSDCPALERLVREQLHQQSRGLEDAVSAALDSGDQARVIFVVCATGTLAMGFALGWFAGRLSSSRRRPARVEALATETSLSPTGGNNSPARIVGPATPGSLRREKAAF